MKDFPYLRLHDFTWAFLKRQRWHFWGLWLLLLLLSVLFVYAFFNPFALSITLKILPFDKALILPIATFEQYYRSFPQYHWIYYRYAYFAAGPISPLVKGIPWLLLLWSLSWAQLLAASYRFNNLLAYVLFFFFAMYLYFLQIPQGLQWQLPLHLSEAIIIALFLIPAYWFRNTTKVIPTLLQFLW